MTTSWKILALAALLTPVAVPLAAQACPDAAAVTAYLADFRAVRPSAGFGKALTAESAACARSRLLAELPAILGPRIGYKALFTNVESQRRFGVDGPAWGAMFGGQMLASGARLPARFGAKPRYEADFIVIVRDAGLADARTPAEALLHLTALVPFIELPDLMIDGSPNGLELIATNAAFRGGVSGTPIPVTGPALADSLASMEVVMTEDVGGREIARARGSVLMDNPLNAAIWLARELRRAGIELRAGDQLSLGGFISSQPTQPNTRISVRYVGLPGDPVVSVAFD
jgi:2-keto-4-pentenoate hydratase